MQCVIIPFVLCAAYQKNIRAAAAASLSLAMADVLGAFLLDGDRHLGKTRFGGHRPAILTYFRDCHGHGGAGAGGGA